LSTYYIEHSLNINRPIERVRSNLIDYKQWTKWSPWFMMEPNATVNYNDKQGEVGASYTWSGLLIGEGTMELLEIRDYALKMELTFEKPFKSKANINFSLEELEDKTVVTCHIDGKLPLYMFWIQKKMKEIMSMQYTHGLHMFKEYLEEGVIASFVHSKSILSVEQQLYMSHPHKKNIWNKSIILEHNTFKAKYQSFSARLHHVWMRVLNFASIRNIKMLHSLLGYEFYSSNPLTTSKSKFSSEIYLPLK